MLTQINGVLDQQQLQVVQKLVSQGRFAEGGKSAGKAAKRVKHNEELSLEPSRFAELNDLVMGSLVKHPTYQSAAMPLKIAAPYYAHYTAGMSYGDHVDDPIMGQDEVYRSDISMTIFLNSPGEYQGGELIVKTSFGEQRVKLAAGDAILYPSSSRHRVAEVTEGKRLVAVSWIQSVIRDPEKRALLHELNQAREKLLDAKPDAGETMQVNQSYINLVRMWSEL